VRKQEPYFTVYIVDWLMIR